MQTISVSAPEDCFEQSTNHSKSKCNEAWLNVVKLLNEINSRGVLSLQVAACKECSHNMHNARVCISSLMRCLLKNMCDCSRHLQEKHTMSGFLKWKFQYISNRIPLALVLHWPQNLETPPMSYSWFTKSQKIHLLYS